MTTVAFAALGFDPAPGDPGQVEALAQASSSAARAIGIAAGSADVGAQHAELGRRGRGRLRRRHRPTASRSRSGGGRLRAGRCGAAQLRPGAASGPGGSTQPGSIALVGRQIEPGRRCSRIRRRSFALGSRPPTSTTRLSAARIVFTTGSTRPAIVPPPSSRRPPTPRPISALGCSHGPRQPSIGGSTTMPTPCGRRRQASRRSPQWRACSPSSRFSRPSVRP